MADADRADLHQNLAWPRCVKVDPFQAEVATDFSQNRCRDFHQNSPSVRAPIAAGPEATGFGLIGCNFTGVGTLMNVNQRYAENLIARVVSRVTPWGDSPLPLG